MINNFATFLTSYISSHPHNLCLLTLMSHMSQCVIKTTNDLCTRQRPKSAWTSIQSDQIICWPHPRHNKINNQPKLESRVDTFSFFGLCHAQGYVSFSMHFDFDRVNHNTHFAILFRSFNYYQHSVSGQVFIIHSISFSSLLYFSF